MQHFRRVVLPVSANRFGSAASSGDKVHMTWQVQYIVRVSFLAGAAFGEVPPCVECHFSWRAHHLGFFCVCF